MKRIILIAIAILLIAGQSIAQSHFLKKYGVQGKENNEFGTAITKTSDGHYILTGYTSAFGSYNAAVIEKKNVNGQTIWSRKFRRSQNHLEFTDAAALPNGQIAVLGNTYVSAQNKDIVVFVLSVDGNQIIGKTRFGGGNSEEGTAITVNDAGEIFITGHRFNEIGTKSSLFLAKLDDTCTIIWQKNYPSSTSTFGTDLVILDNGEIVVAGYNNERFMIAKTDGTGNHICSNTYGPEGSGRLYSIIKDKSGHLVATGVRKHADGNRIAFLKFSNDCNLLFSKDHYIAYESLIGLELIQNIDGDYIIAGVNERITDSEEWPFLLALSRTDGTFKWAKRYESTNSFENGPMGLTLSYDYGYSLITSYSTSPLTKKAKALSNNDFFYLKTNAQGAIKGASCFDPIKIKEGELLLNAQNLDLSSPEVNLTHFISIDLAKLDFIEIEECSFTVDCLQPLPGDREICTGESTNILLVPGFYNYINWTKDGVPLTGLPNPKNLEVTEEGLYCVSARRTNGCVTNMCIQVNERNCTLISEGCDQACFEGRDLVKDGDFDSGTPSFDSDLLEDPYGLCLPETYFVATNSAQKCNTFINLPAFDGTSNYLIVEGQDNASIWRKTIDVASGRDYTFAFKYFPRLDDNPSVTLGMKINGILVKDNITSSSLNWVQVCQNWTDPAPPVPIGGVYPITIEIVQTGTPGERAYGIDDIVFYECSNEHSCPALEFANGQYVTAPKAIMDEMACQSFTLEAWIRAENDGSVAHPTLLSNRDASGGISFFLHHPFGGATNKLLAVQINGVNYLDVSYPNVMDGECHHVAVVRNGTVLSFFADGVWIGNRNIPSSFSVSSTKDLLIGRDASSTTMRFTGMIKKIRIWKTARSNYDIQSTVNTSLSGGETGLVALYKMDNGTGQLVEDYSTNIFDAYLGSTIGGDSKDPMWIDDCCEPGKMRNAAKEKSKRINTIPDIQIEKVTQPFKITAFPNPASDQIRITAGAGKEVSILDQNGRNMITVTIPKGTSRDVDISQLPNGLYILKNELGEAIKFIKQ